MIEIKHITFKLGLGAISLCLSLITSSIPAQAAIIQFDILGRDGAGLLPGNENPLAASGTGSGGEIGSGIFFDTDTNVLSYQFGYGSAEGFTDLTGAAVAWHIHGPAADDPLLNNAPVLINFDTLGQVTPDINPALGGRIVGSVDLDNVTGANPQDLLSSRYYINIHTLDNPAGEIRGNLVQQVPEPSQLLGLLTIGGIALGASKKKQS